MNENSNNLIEIEWNCNQAKIQLQLRLNNEPYTLSPIIDMLKNNHRIEANIHCVNPIKDSHSQILLDNIYLNPEHNLDKIIKDIKDMPKVHKCKVRKIELFDKIS